MMLPSAPLLLPVTHLLQRQQGDCLVACAAMVLAYLGRPIAYDQLLKTLDIQRGVGTPFYKLQVLTRLKITVIYEQGTLAQLRRFLSSGWPCIVPVKSRELAYWEKIDIDHSVVVVGMGSSSIYLNDPAFTSAPIEVQLGDFDLAWFERGERYVVLAP